MREIDIVQKIRREEGNIETKVNICSRQALCLLPELFPEINQQNKNY